MIILAVILGTLLAQFASAQESYATVLAEQLNQYCVVHGGGSTKTASAPRIGKAGPMGPPGRPGIRGPPGPTGPIGPAGDVGRTGEVNYARVKELVAEAISEMHERHDCTDTRGITRIYPETYPDGMTVYCDATTDGGGWIVFQRRQDGSVNFTRNWFDYTNGFGDLTGEYWMGLEKVHRLTSGGKTELRIDLGDWEGNRAYAKYSEFSVSDSSDNYRLDVGGYTGTAGNGMDTDDNFQFSTFDRDNDVDAGSCSKVYKGGWWFSACYDVHLNGIYHNQRGGGTSAWKGIIWDEWKGNSYSLKFTEMKFRRKRG